MLNKTIWNKIFKAQADFDISRRKIISEGARVLHASKNAIFALQRDKYAEAKEAIAEAKKDLVSLDKRFGKDFRLRMEGSWKAAVEEFVEASLFYDFCVNKKIGDIKGFNIEADEYVGGLSDVSGEILRKMIYWATKKKFRELKLANEAVDEIIYELMQNNFTGYLRTKVDQAKRNLHKAEEVMYDVSLRD